MEDLERLKAENKRLKEEVKHYEALVGDLTSSISWRVTAPLRFFNRIRKIIWPLFSSLSIPLTAEAGRNTAIENELLVLKGVSPTFPLRAKSPLPERWCEIVMRLDSESPHRFFLLYFSRQDSYEDSAFNVHDRIWLSVESGKLTRHVVNLPPDVKTLRLDPFESNGSFSVKRLEIRRLGSMQLAKALFAKHIAPVLSRPDALFVKLKKGVAAFRAGGIPALRAKLVSDSFTSNYIEWVKRYDTLSTVQIDGMKRYARQLESTPLISVLMPTYNTPQEFLVKAIDSVREQIYQNWELCVADDASTEPRVMKILERYAGIDKRIKVQRRATNGHISEASNTALSMATGEYVALLDHDDELPPHALLRMVIEVNECPSAELIYSDEDKKTEEGLRFNPYFKSGFNPLLFWSQNFVCHLTVIRRQTLEAVGGFRKGFEGAQDWDLFLRVIDAVGQEHVRHIPEILYHWRAMSGSTAQSTAFKPYVMEAQRKAVEEHLARRKITGARVEILEAISQLRVHLPVPIPEPLVSIIIPTKDRVSYLKVCIDSILKDTRYRNFEILVVDNGSSHPETFAYFEQIKATGLVNIIRDDRPFNFSRLNNLAVKSARGSMVAFLNNDLEVIAKDWLTEMVSLASLPETGAVGARLLYPSGLVQHAGVVLGIGGVAGHNHKGRPQHDPGYFNRLILPQNFSAVTAACLVMRKEVFEQIGGFDEDKLAVAFNDVDLCLKVRAAGYLVAYTPYAELYHHESVSRGLEDSPEKFQRFEAETAVMKKRWAEILASDPYYNPNLSVILEDFSFAFPPRQVHPYRKNLQKVEARSTAAVAA